jgi:class 3 adenylate cyclase
MTLKDELQTEVKKIFADSWTTRDGTTVPEAENLKLGNDAVKLNAAVLYADLSASTKLVENSTAAFAAEIYKTYLHCAAKIIRAESGVVTAYDGDRVMGVFIGEEKEHVAVRAALKINWARVKIINPAIKAQYSDKDYQVSHTVGVDTSALFVARTGVRGANDLVWVGRAANYAAKLAALPPTHATRITAAVYAKLQKSTKETDGQSMWESASWTDMNKITIYRSTWMWGL